MMAELSSRMRTFGVRRGRTLIKVAVALAICLLIGFLFVASSGRFSGAGVERDAIAVLVHNVERGDFVSIVTEAGDIESASNIEVRCDVKSEGGAGTTILEVVDEGTIVKEGDFLLQFDDSAIQLSLTQQEIQVATDQALVIQAKSELDKFSQMLNEYKDGLFVMERETFESLLLQAESHLKSVQDSLDFRRRMFRKGYVSPIEVEAQVLAEKMAQKAVQAARTSLMVHNDFTRQRMISEYEAEIEKQKALLTAAEYTLQLSEHRRDQLTEQINYCRVVAPAEGQVVYRNDYRRRPPVVIEEGAQIRQGQVIFRLPDPQQMQVDLRINDSKINLVSVGDQCEIELDSDPDLKIRGELIEIAPFGRRDWDRGPIRYTALVRVVNPPTALRSGMRTKVHIFIERRDDVVQAPIQSVVGRDEDHFCLVKDKAGKWGVRQVDVGPSNDSYVIVVGGLDVGEQVALNPDLIWDDVAGESFRADESTDSSESPAVSAIGG
jgi:multidrug efflux pump subunit AcrA (membrane-fusion protein)